MIPLIQKTIRVRIFSEKGELCAATGWDSGRYFRSAPAVRQCGPVSGQVILVNETLLAGRSGGVRLRNAQRFSQEEGKSLLHKHGRVFRLRCSLRVG
jgi:hypothetical protein